MTRVITILISILCITNILNAQTIQKGIIQEYNEKAKKTPLSGVELNVRSAQNTVSDKSGQFSLRFLTLKPGEKVNVRRIEKLGYEIFNKEAIEQWNINPKTPFVIVMCRAEKFKAIRDNYQRVASASYDRQYKKEQSRLAKLKEDGKIKEAEYQKQLAELMENYDRQLDNLDNYVDKFSRIDLSELSSIEQEIIELVQLGRFEEAIQKYEEQNYLDKYRKEVSDIKEVSSAIDQLSELKQTKELTRDSLLSAIDRYIETLRLAGGYENFKTIGDILYERYKADTTNYISLKKYAEYLYDNKIYDKAVPVYQNLITIHDTIDNDIFNYYNNLSLMEKDLGEFDKALSYSVEAEKIYLADTTIFTPSKLAGIKLNRALIHYKQREINKAKQLLIDANSYIESHKCDSKVMASIKNSLANIYGIEQDKEHALELYIEIYKIYLDNNDNSAESNECLAGSLLNISQTYRALKEYDNAICYISTALSYINSSYNYNPLRYSSQYINILTTAGNIYSDINEMKKAEEYYNEALNLSHKEYENNSNQYWEDYVGSLINLAILKTSLKEYPQAIDFFNHAISTMQDIQESKRRSENMASILYNLSYIYCINEQYNEAILLLTESLQYAKYLFDYNKRYGANMYLNSLNNLAYCYDEVKEYGKAKEMYLNIINIINELDLTEIVPFNINYADAIYNLGYHLHNKENLYNEAISKYLNAYELYNKLEKKNDIIQTIIGISNCYIELV